MIDLSNFDWGWMNRPVEYDVDGQVEYLWHINPNGSKTHMSEYHKNSIIKEIFEDKCYEQFFEVEEGDTVLDVGASVGPFTYSILHKKPKQVYCF
jgi:2-polyprenyl-3-methyl-5-hydroxy-6-metoxy-1,4-benzoquinol methylase